MSTFQIPNTKGQTRQNNRSDTFGELMETFNIDLNRKFGKIFPSKKLVKVLDEDTHLDEGDVVAFEFYSGDYYLATDGDLYRSTSGDPTDPDNWSEVTQITTTLSRGTDLVVFGGLLLMSVDNDVMSWNGSTFDNNWWNDLSGSPTLSDATQMHVHRGGQETLFVLNGNKVHYYNSTAGFSTVTLQTDFVATCVTSGVNAIWVGVESESGSNAYVYEIYIGETDSFSTPIARNAYKIEGTKVMSIEVVDNIPYIITEKGNIQAFNGAGFSTVASFPFANTTEVINKSAVHPKGMKLHNDSLLINIATERRSQNQTDYVEGCPSGIWEFNRITGQLHHRFAFADTDTDKGATETDGSNSGPIFIIDNEYGLLFAAGENDASGSTSGMYADIGSQYGYFKTVEINSDTIQDAYERVYAKAKTMADGESIELKYRTRKLDSVFCDGAMLGTTQFNTTDDISAITADENGTYNWEVTDIHSGRFAQVTNVVKNASTYEVFVDTPIGTDGDTNRFEFQNWTDSTETYTSDDGEVKSWGEFGVNPWIQFKAILNGAIELRQFMSKGNSKQER